MAIAALKSAARNVSQATGIAQDNIIFAMVLFAFIVWITTKNELPIYLAFFRPGANGVDNPLGIDQSVAASSTTGGSNPVQTVTGLLSGAPGQGGAFAGGSTDPVAGSITQAIKSLPAGSSFTGAILGMGN